MKNVKTPILYGFIIALAGSVLMGSLIGFELLGPNAVATDKEMIGGTVLFLLIYLFLLFGIYFVLKNKKDENGARLSYKEAFIQGLVASVSTALCSVVLTYLFYELLYPDYVTELLAAIKEKMELGQIPEEKIAEKLAEKKAYFSTSMQSLYSFTGNLITGLAFTLLLSFFLKTKND